MIDSLPTMNRIAGLFEDNSVDDCGELSVLNCTAGDISIKFDKDNDDDIAKAKAIIQDMQRRGYLIFVTTPEGTTERVSGFDPNTCEYIIKNQIIANMPIRIARKTHQCVQCHTDILSGTTYYDNKGKKTHVTCGVITRKVKSTKRLPLTKTKAIGVAPTAGG